VYRQPSLSGGNSSQATRKPSPFALNRPVRSRRVLDYQPVAGWWLGIALVAVVGCGSSSESPPAAPSPQPQVSEPADPAAELAQAVAARDWTAAVEIGQRAMIAHPNDPDVLTNVAIATAQSGDRVRAASLLVDAAAAGGYAINDSRIDNAILALLDVGRIFDAIDLLEAVVQQHPDASSYRRRLVGFLGEVQQTLTIDEHMQKLIQDRQFDLPLLLATTDMTSRRFSMESIAAILDRNPDDLRPRLAQAQYQLDKRDTVGAEKILREIVARHPDFAAAHAMLGSTLVTQGNFDELESWSRALPEKVDRYPGYWVALGQWSATNGQPLAAIRSFAEATRRDPNDGALWARLASAMRAVRQQVETDENAEFESVADFDWDAVSRGMDGRRDQLLQLRDRMAEFKTDGEDSQRLAVAVAQSLIDLGRYWEAEAWLALALRMRKDRSTETQTLRQHVVEKLSADRDWQSVEGHPELAFDLTAFSLPDSTAIGGTNSKSTVSLQNARPIAMADQAQERGLEFYGRVGDQVNGPRIPIAQTLGCGGGTIDFDNDGRHDLAFAAAGGDIRKENSDPGALYRNLDGQLKDVSQMAGFADRGFGHGIVVGDINDDGFQDILILNLGKNRVLRNNGDGTCADATERLGPQTEAQWSTSGAIVDLDSDGWNDIYIARYCDATEPLDQPCFDASGQEINCYPLRFRAAVDQVLKGNGDGTFQDVSARIADVRAGRGLGVVAGRLDGQNHSLYVVNDASANSYLQFSGESVEEPLSDLGIATGLALDAQSLDQGSMGIATADFDNDGDLDFYVTGFANEYNIFYEQQAAGFWSDLTAAAGMVSPTLKTVGFGTEAMDLDGDGVVELVVTNGHIGQFGAGAPPMAQPMQVFRRNAQHHFNGVALLLSRRERGRTEQAAGTNDVDARFVKVRHVASAQNGSRARQNRLADASRL